MEEEEIKDFIYRELASEIKERMGDVEVSREGDDIIVVDKNKKIKRQYNGVLEKMAGEEISFIL